MTTGAPRVCRSCGQELAEAKHGRYCKNGCQTYTAQPVGSEYLTARGFARDDDGRVWETGGVGGVRRLPTCTD